MNNVGSLQQNNNKLISYYLTCLPWIGGYTNFFCKCSLIVILFLSSLKKSKLHSWPSISITFEKHKRSYFPLRNYKQILFFLNKRSQ